MTISNPPCHSLTQIVSKFVLLLESTWLAIVNKFGQISNVMAQYSSSVLCKVLAVSWQYSGRHITVIMDHSPQTLPKT